MPFGSVYIGHSITHACAWPCMQTVAWMTCSCAVGLGVKQLEYPRRPCTYQFGNRDEKSLAKPRRFLDTAMSISNQKLPSDLKAESGLKGTHLRTSSPLLQAVCTRR
uniref:Uncharacterized protein n=1 Tax=Chrysotila carterae TaxID=13221 RepID=A0A7S4C0P8_CHRCT